MGALHLARAVNSGAVRRARAASLGLVQRVRAAALMVVVAAALMAVRGLEMLAAAAPVVAEEQATESALVTEGLERAA